MAKGILIDPYMHSIVEVQVGDYKDISKHLRCSIFSGGGRTKYGDSIFVNDNGFNEESEFWHCPELYPDPYAGRVLILGCDASGEDKDAEITLDEVLRLDQDFYTSQDLINKYAKSVYIDNNLDDANKHFNLSMKRARRKPIDMTASQTSETANQYLAQGAIRNVLCMLEDPESVEHSGDGKVSIIVDETLWNQYVNDRDIIGTAILFFL